MSVMDILRSYLDRPTDTHQDFDDVAQQVPQQALAGGLADTFRSNLTPDFGSMAASLFRGSNPQQQAGLLGQLLRSVAPALLPGIAGGVLDRLKHGAGGPTELDAATTAATVTPDQVQEIAAAAEKQDPSVLDRVGAYYAQHPEVVKVLGGAALAVALGQIANRMKS